MSGDTAREVQERLGAMGIGPDRALVRSVGVDEWGRFRVAVTCRGGVLVTLTSARDGNDMIGSAVAMIAEQIESGEREKERR